MVETVMERAVSVAVRIIVSPSRMKSTGTGPAEGNIGMVRVTL